MKIYPVSDSSYSKIQTGKSDNREICRGSVCLYSDTVSFGSKGGWLAAAGIAVASFLAPVAVLVAGTAVLAGKAAAKLADMAADDDDKKKQISDAGKDMIDDSINDSFPY